MFKERNLKGGMLVLAALSLTFAVGCSTKGQFLVPENTALYLNDRPVAVKPGGTVITRPFFWSTSGGIPYRLEKGGALIQSGMLPSSFRVASIFWPPWAIIYWPIGFRSDMVYDLINDPAAQKYAPAQKTVPAPQEQ